LDGEDAKETSAGLKTSMEITMADARQEDKSKQTAEEAARRGGDRTVDQTKRIAEAAVETGQDVTRVSAEMLQQNAQAMQNILRLGLDMATTVFGRSTDQLRRSLGLSGDEVEQATERSTRNAASVMHSTAAVSRGMNGISQEYFALGHQVESAMNRMDEVWACRTPQDLAAIQSEIVRESVATAVQSTRKIADMSLKAADDASRHIAPDRRAA
jgi:hypothetical protein